MKKIFLLAATAAILAACSDNNADLAENPQQAPSQAQTMLQPGQVGFDAYMQRSISRAGTTGDMTLSVLKGTSSGVGPGFGVFAYYTDNRDYDQLAIPNFMYNQRVKAKFESETFQGWEYSPVMYWPNEYGSNAVSEDADRVSFFAYAPYTVVTPASGKVEPGENKADTWGITSITRNTASGDPIIKYIGSFKAAEAVDLCWGVVPNDPAYTNWRKVQENTPQEFKPGLPWLDVQRPGQTDQRVKFQFKHALAKMQVTVDYVNDAYVPTGEDLDSKTRIWIRSVRIGGFTMKGALNLNNGEAGKPYWLNYNGIGDLVADADVIVYDGRKEGKEGQPDATATNEKSLGLTEAFIQTNSAFNYEATPSTTWAATPAGVGKVAQNLFGGTDGGIFYVIPTGDDLEVEIVYDVETIDPNLPTYLADGKTNGSNIENHISQKITFGNGDSKLDFGKAYSLKLHLGMNSVKFDADIMNWEDMEAIDVDMPSNLPHYAAGTDASITIPYSATSFSFALTGLNGGEAVAGSLPENSAKYHNTSATESATSTTNIEGWLGSNGNALTNGIYVAQLTSTANKTFCNRTQNVTWKPAQSSSTTTTVTFTQLAHPLQLHTGDSYGIANTATAGTELQLKSTAGSSIDKGWMCDGLENNCKKLTASTADGNDHGVAADQKDKHYIYVWRNGAQLTWAETPAAGKFSFDDSTGKITFNETTKTGDVIRITLKTGDAPEETITVTIQ